MGNEHVLQRDVVEGVIKRMADSSNSVSLEKSVEMKKLVQNIVQNLIVKENMLQITQDAKVKDDRYLALGLNIDLNELPNMEGGGETMY